MAQTRVTSIRTEATSPGQVSGRLLQADAQGPWSVAQVSASMGLPLGVALAALVAGLLVLQAQVVTADVVAGAQAVAEAVPDQPEAQEDKAAREP